MSWNFFWTFPNWKKCFRGWWIHFLPNNESKCSKNYKKIFASILQKTWKWTKFISFKVFTYNLNFLLILWIFKPFLALFLGIHKSFKFGFLALLVPFLDQKMNYHTPRTNFSIKGMSTKNFSSKFQLWAKTIAAPSGVQTVTAKKHLCQTQEW